MYLVAMRVRDFAVLYGNGLKTQAYPYATNVEFDGNILILRGGSWCHENKKCRVSRRYASDRSKKTSGFVLRVMFRENIE